MLTKEEMASNIIQRKIDIPVLLTLSWMHARTGFLKSL